jgi:hypothetical protein
MDRHFREEESAATDHATTDPSATERNNSTAAEDRTLRFLALFSGFEHAYGTYEAKKAGDSGKVNGRALTVRGKLPLERMQGHLNGDGIGVGIVTLREDNTCCFGVIDVDIQGAVKLREDLPVLEKRIKALKLPLVLCRSKSGGAHLYLFMSEPVSAVLMREKLNEWAAALGYKGCETFPKQYCRVDKEEDVGNWINLPYYKARATMRYALLDGRGIHFGEFLDLAESKRVSIEDLKNLLLPRYPRSVQATRRALISV